MQLQEPIYDNRSQDVTAGAMMLLQEQDVAAGVKMWLQDENQFRKFRFFQIHGHLEPLYLVLFLLGARSQDYL